MSTGKTMKSLVRRKLPFRTCVLALLSVGLLLAAGLAQATAPLRPSLNGKIAFTRLLPGANNEIFLMNPDGSGQTNLTNDPAYDEFAAGAPDGSKIAFTRLVGGGPGDIFVMNPDGSGQTNLTNTPAPDEHPDWSPDGQKIAFGSYAGSGSNWEIVVMDADGSNATT